MKAPPRYVTDLWLSLNELVKGQTHPPTNSKDWTEQLGHLVNAIGHEARQALEEDLLLSLFYRERLVDALGNRLDEGWLQAMQFIESQSASIPGRVIALQTYKTIPGSLHADYLQSWNLWDVSNRNEARQIEIGERAKALLILLHDLLALERDGGIIGDHPLSPSSLDLGWAYASWDVGDVEEVRVPWITPAWTSFWEFDQLAHAWNEALRNNKEWQEQSPNKVTFLAYHWIAAITLLFSGKNPLKPLSRGSPKEEDWQAVVKTSAELLKLRPSVRKDRIDSWLARLPVLLAPETGIPEEVRQKFANNKALKAHWNKPEIASKVRRLRARHLLPFKEKGSLLKSFTPEGRTFPPAPKLTDFSAAKKAQANTMPFGHRRGYQPARWR